MMKSWTRLSLTGWQVGWITKTSLPRTDSAILTSNSPSAKRVTWISASGMLISRAMRSLSSGFAVPESRRRSPCGLLIDVSLPGVAVCGPGATARAPPLDGALLAALDGERTGGHVVRDHRTRGDEGVVADVARRHQQRVAADEGAIADHGAVLGDAVVVDGDRAGADVDAGADV